MTTLVIVESPTKAKTIKDFLPKGYEVMASMGHIRDLPQSAADIPAELKKEEWSQLGVNVDSAFEPIYIIPKEKQKIIKEMKAKLKDADELLLATDEDREGESISWHLLDVIQKELPKKKKIEIKRMVFHEITKEAILKALKETRDIDMDLVHAQETRRVLDRLVGYSLSPILWKKVSVGLSAGRVQSVSIRVLVQKERERRAFKKGSYWDLQAELSKGGKKFNSTLINFDGKKLATGADFDENTGKIKKGKDVLQMDEKTARELTDRLMSASWSVESLTEKQSTQKPSPPFITSSLQQEANRKLRLSPRRCMQVAQGLYEKGFITYMRTDSVNLSDQALKAARNAVSSKFGKEYLTDKPKVFANKSKGAQEAHEAIRPSGSSFPNPDKTGLSGVEKSLYDLIWKRTLATQMKDAKLNHLTALIKAEEATFRATGKNVLFPGFFLAYVEGDDNPEGNMANKEVLLPPLKEGDELNKEEVEPKGHETKPPARYTEASLVKKLETEGIGRPSTYASIIDTIQNRGYVNIQSHTLVPTFVAFAVTSLLENNFADLVDPGFTAGMEEVLDKIAQGEQEWLPYMKKFFSGKKGLLEKAKVKTEEIAPGEYRQIQFDGLNAKVCIGRFCTLLEQGEGEDKITASIPADLTPAELDQERVDLILLQKSKGNEELGIHPELEKAVYILNGAYGPYVQLGEVEEGGPKPKRVTLPKGMKESEVDMETATFLLSLPRTIGEHPDGGTIKVGISRFGSYVVLEKPEGEKDFRSIPKEENIVNCTLDRALELLAQEKKGRKKASTALKELGEHPEAGGPIGIFNGPYGHYVKHGKVNASIPKDTDIEDVTMDMAVEWLAAKKVAKPRGRKAKK